MQYCLKFWDEIIWTEKQVPPRTTKVAPILALFIRRTSMAVTN